MCEKNNHDVIREHFDQTHISGKGGAKRLQRAIYFKSVSVRSKLPSFGIFAAQSTKDIRLKKKTETAPQFELLAKGHTGLRASQPVSPGTLRLCLGQAKIRKMGEQKMWLRSNKLIKGADQQSVALHALQRVRASVDYWSFMYVMSKCNSHDDTNKQNTHVTLLLRDTSHEVYARPSRAIFRDLALNPRNSEYSDDSTRQ